MNTMHNSYVIMDPLVQGQPRVVARLLRMQESTPTLTPSLRPFLAGLGGNWSDTIA